MARETKQKKEAEGVKRNKKLFIIMKIEYGTGEENVYTEILNATSSKSTALAIKERYMEEYKEQIHTSHEGRWVSIQMHQCGIQLDDEILEDDLFIRYIEGSSKMCHES